MTIMNIKVTFWRVLFVVIMIAGLYSTYVRYLHGLGAVSNMNDQYPWGLWIGFDCLCGVMLAAGGFCVTGAVYIFHVERLHSVCRPAILTAFLGYVLFIVGLLFDLGRPWFIWHQMIYMNFHSVMFEVGMCVMTYTTVLFLEFLPNVLERFNLAAPIRWVKKIYPVLVCLGILLSTLHQSSLGSLFLIFPEKMSPFWYTPALPFLFFGSAISVGLAMTIFESTQSAKAFGRQLELPVLVELGGALLVALWVNALLRFEDRNSMAHSIEARVPYVDRELATCALRLPESELMHKGFTKYPLRAIAARVLPASIAWRRFKVGFEPPTARWLAGISERMQHEVESSSLIACLARRVPSMRETPLPLQWRLFNLARWQQLFAVGVD